jgi:hypothetical protein
MPFLNRGSAVFAFTPLPLAISAWAFRGAAYSSASPASFFERAAWVLVLAAFCEWLAARRRPTLPLFAGKHSLTLYVVHLVLISTLAECGLPAVGLRLPEVLPLIAVVAVLSLFVTWLIDRARRAAR